jgi:hypothetical protein
MADEDDKTEFKTFSTFEKTETKKVNAFDFDRMADEDDKLRFCTNL